MPTVKSSPWVEKRSHDIVGNTFLSTIEKRLVFFCGGNILQVLPPGKHRVPFRFPFTKGGIDAVGYVNMLPGQLPIAAVEGMLTSDQMPVDVSLIATIAVLDVTNAITSVAIDPDGQTAIAENFIVKHLQAIVREGDWRALSGDQRRISAELQKRITSEPSQRQSFAIIDIVVRKIAVSDPAIREHEVRLERERQSLQETRLAVETQQHRDEYEAKKRSIEWEAERKQKRDSLTDDYEYAKRMAELKQQEEDRAAKVRIHLAQIRADAEVKVAEARSRLAGIEWIVREATSAGENSVLRKLLEASHNIRLDGLPPLITSMAENAQENVETSETKEKTSDEGTVTANDEKSDPD